MHQVNKLQRGYFPVNELVTMPVCSQGCQTVLWLIDLGFLYS